MRLILTFVLLMLVWLLWSGFFKPLLISLGLLSCLFTLFLARRMGFFKREVFSLHLAYRLIPFWGWLALELIKSNLTVARIVLSPKMVISPTVVQLTAQSDDPVLQAILGNSITLTPGTVTLDDHEGELLVHCLTRQGADALLEGDMNRRVAALQRS
ncbi:MAG: Na+/H+ antiporter subunit E [Pseudomonadaceae bacterium]|nr:Na+/H+ antiporter subunit E [Pseudomonadaceae bacterium]